MKLDEVPQDEAYLEEGKIRDVCYALDKDGHYTRVYSKGWIPKNEAIRLAWDRIYEHAGEIRELVVKGKLSPIAFFMELNVMDAKILAQYLGISKWRVRRHMRMKGFKKISPGLLERYAEALKVTPGELADIEAIRKRELKHED